MEILEVTLPSITIFWEDLGLPERRKMTREQEDFLADYWDEHLDPWIKEYVKGDCNPWEKGVWFANGRDAMFFKLSWAGRIPLSR
jgi:hypothetical protein